MKNVACILWKSGLCVAWEGADWNKRCVCSLFSRVYQIPLMDHSQPHAGSREAVVSTGIDCILEVH